VPAAAAQEQAPFAGALLAAAEEHPELVVLSADLSKYTDILPFAERHPERFFQVGMAEQNMMGIAGGLAKSGFLPVAVTYGVFATRRAFEQMAMAFSTGPSRAIVVAFLPGITTPFRATHQATDDLALARAIPGMAVIDPGDATELAGALHAAVEHDGPVYMRGLRGRVARLFDPAETAFRLGEARLVRGGGAVGVITTGIAAEWVADALEDAQLRGVDAGWLHVPTIKPLDADAVAGFCARFRAVLTIENHSTIGGLGSAVAEVIAGRGVGCRLRPLGVPDRWAPAGSLPYVRGRLGLDREALAHAIAAATNEDPA
jgi:transketolase